MIDLDRGLRFHHLGLAVRRPAEAVTFLTALGYQVGAALFDPLQKVNLQFCTHPEKPAVEIIYPGEGQTPLDGILKQRDALAYHCCFETQSSTEAIASLEARGLRVLPISPIKAAALFPGQAVSFYQIPGFGLFELLEPAPLLL